MMKYITKVLSFIFPVYNLLNSHTSNGLRLLVIVSLKFNMLFSGAAEV